MTRGVHGRAVLGTDADFVALATLRTLRGKLTYAVEITQRPDQLALILDSRPPEGGGTIGGDDLAITPQNLVVVNHALATGGEGGIVMDPVAPAEWRSETETGVSRETVAQLLPRISRGIERILARVHAG